MKVQALAGPLISAVPENRAQSCQISGRWGAFDTQIALQDRRDGLRLLSVRVGRMLLFLLILPASLRAQKPQDSWSNLNRLKAGQGIEVIDFSMKRHSGRFVSLTDESVSLQEKGSDVLIKREDIVRVSTGSGPRRGEHALIGLVVGGAIGAGLGAAAGSAHGFLGGSSRGITALVGIAIGAPSGALVGAGIPARTTVYRVAPGAHRTISP
jgi:hypothetical protein